MSGVHLEDKLDGLQQLQQSQDNNVIAGERVEAKAHTVKYSSIAALAVTQHLPAGNAPPRRLRSSGSFSTNIRRMGQVALRAARFVGPGAMVSVSYIDPGNYATGITAGASFRFDLLCVVFVANILAIFLQSLCLRLGTVTGRDLARLSRERFPLWLIIIGYLFAEAAIIATDLAEVIGVAIALNILSGGKIPLAVGVAITMLDVIIVLFFYNRNPDGKNALTRTQIFEVAVAVLVLAVAICFAVELSKLSGVSAGEVFRGYLPSKTIVQSKGLYDSCGILGATVMPHSLYLGSGLVQARLQDYDIRHGFWHSSALNPETSFGTYEAPTALEREMQEEKYQPSLAAIRHCLPYSLAELIFSLATFALFINSAIVITSGATLYGTPEADDADLFSIYELLKTQLSRAAATIFVIALLLSGQSAGLVVTLAGQIVSEGYIRWNITPWKRRLVTRAIAITPCIVVASAVGRTGLAGVLNGSQVALSIILPFVSAPLIWFTSRRDVMSVDDPSAPEHPTDSGAVGAGNTAAVEDGGRSAKVDMSNSWPVTIFGIFVWLFISGLNVYLVISLALGN